MKNNRIWGIFARYILIILVGLGNLWLFYKLFSYPTLITVRAALGLFSTTGSIENIITFSGTSIELISACIAGAAYYLLFILVFSTNGLKIKKRLEILLFCYLIFFLLNVIRIVVLALIINNPAFNIVHEIFWYFLSTMFVVLIWILAVKLFKIKSIPVYDDIREMIK